MYNKTITVKNEDLEGGNQYACWQTSAEKIKKEARMRVMDKDDQAINSLYYLLDGLEPHERLRAIQGLAKIWKELHDKDDESEKAYAIARFVGSYCHICGEHCREVVDEKHDESYIVCQTGGQFRKEYIDTARETGELCPNYGWDTVSIQSYNPECDKKEFNNLIKEQKKYHKKRGRKF